MRTVFALLCFVVVIHWLIFPYPSGLLHWHCGNLTIAPVPEKQPWWIWINTSCEFIMNDCITTSKQSTTKPCAYFLGYTVFASQVWYILEFEFVQSHYSGIKPNLLFQNKVDLSNVSWQTTNLVRACFCIRSITNCSGLYSSFVYKHNNMIYSVTTFLPVWRGYRQPHGDSVNYIHVCLYYKL